MNKLDMNLFAFVAFINQNQHSHSISGLSIDDGYEWYNYMWNQWLRNSDAGREIMNRGINNIPDTNRMGWSTGTSRTHPTWTSTTTWDKLDTTNSRMSAMGEDDEDDEVEWDDFLVQ
jgi:hypothetical protein